MNNMKKVLITGSHGFVGSHLVNYLLRNTDWEITCIDRFDASGNINRLVEVIRECNDSGIDVVGRIKVLYWDLKAEINDQFRKQLGGPFDYIMHLAAGSHVDRSIEDPDSFVFDNTIGTLHLLNYARNGGLKYDGFANKFLYFSTDEVFGPAPEGVFYKEWDRHNPNNPYAASKSAAEQLCIAFANTYRMPIVITNTMNIFGERQHPEKFIPLVIQKCLTGDNVTIHANKEKTEAGKRHYLHARNVASAAVWAVENGKTLDGSANQGRYNIVGEQEVDNLTLAQLIHSYVKELRPDIPDLNYELVDFHSQRPGHDLRYGLDGSLLASEGFSYPSSFEESLKQTVRWYLDIRNSNWL